MASMSSGHNGHTTTSNIHGVHSAGALSLAASRKLPALPVDDVPQHGSIYAKFARSSSSDAVMTAVDRSRAPSVQSPSMRPPLPSPPILQPIVNPDMPFSNKSLANLTTSTSNNSSTTISPTTFNVGPNQSDYATYRPHKAYTRSIASDKSNKSSSSSSRMQKQLLGSSLTGRILSALRVPNEEQAKSIVPFNREESSPGHSRNVSTENLNLGSVSIATPTLDLSPSPARSTYLTAQEEEENDKISALPKIPSSPVRDTEEVFGSPRFSSDAPPTTSPKAIDVLVGVPTGSAKAISKLTGIKVKKPSTTAPDVPSKPQIKVVQQPPNLLRSKQNDEPQRLGTANTVGHLADESENEGEDVPPTKFRLHNGDMLPDPVTDLKASSRASSTREKKISRQPRVSQTSSAGSTHNALPNYTLPPPMPSVPSRILSTGSQQPIEDLKRPMLYKKPARRTSASSGSTVKAAINRINPTIFHQHSNIKLDKSDAASIISNSPSAYDVSRANQDTLACLYVVSGLPRDPSTWSFANVEPEPAHLDNAVPRFYRAEVLGVMIAGGGEAAPDSLDASIVPKSKKNRVNELKRDGPSRAASVLSDINAKQAQVSREEAARIQAKAVKLSMPRDIEVIAAPSAPASTYHTFSFTLQDTGSSTTPSADSGMKGSIGASWDLAIAQAARSSISSNKPSETTYYGATLTVWTHADKNKADAIRQAIEAGTKVRTAAIARATKAAAAGRRLGEKLARASVSNNGLPAMLGPKARAGNETEAETEACFSETDWEAGSAPLSASIAELPFLKSSMFWQPYALTLVSKYPLYDLLSDTLRISWARYHLQVVRHSMTMRTILEFPVPQAQKWFKVPVDPLSDASGAFNVQMPGKISVHDGRPGINHQIWPLLRCLDADNILRIAEIALAPFGRILFTCRHLYLLNLAVEVFKYLLEPLGWRGLTGLVHARDIAVLQEDPGAYLLAIDSRCVHMLRDISPEVCIVDLEANRVTCTKPPIGYLYSGELRERRVKRLTEALGNITHFAVPVELTEAYPNGRFRPFSAVEVNGIAAPAEQLLPPSNWHFQLDYFLEIMQDILSVEPEQNALRRFFKIKPPKRKPITLEGSAIHVQQIVRNQSASFVDKRDMLEIKMWRMNKRLALLMRESQSWNTQFSQFQVFSDKLNSEAHNLRTKLDKEKREAKCLNQVIVQSKQANDDLSAKLQAAEQARTEAATQLAQLDQMEAELEKQREALQTRMQNLLDVSSDADLLETIVQQVEMQKEQTVPRTPSSTSAISPSLSERRMSLDDIARRSAADADTSNDSIRRSRALSSPAAGILLVDRPLSISRAETDDEKEIRRLAVRETMRAVQERLASALAAVKEEHNISLDTNTSSEIEGLSLISGGKPASPSKSPLRPAFAA